MKIQSIDDVHHALQSKQLSAKELAQSYLQRLAQPEAKALNAFLAVNEEVTLREAERADQRIAAGTATILTGIPIAHKDVFVTKNWPTTAASKILRNYMSPFNATVVERLSSAGTVCVGKANMDEFAMGSTNENSAYGRACNPWDTGKVPGGSSGGSAVAVAANLALAATGTDTGGSIRQPASLCGITGLKPTYGLVSRYGMIAYASSLDQAGPMAKSAKDCAHLLQVMVGKDDKDSTSIKADVPNYAMAMQTPWTADASTGKPLAGLRIGVPAEYFGEGLDTGVQQAVEEALKQFEQLGAVCVRVSLPKTRLAIPVYYVIAPAEASSNLSRFDGVRYGFRANIADGDLQALYTQTRGQGFGEEVQRRILAGTYVLSHGYYDAYYLQAQKLRRVIAEDFQAALQQCDVIMGPVAPTTAWDFGAKANPVSMYLSDIYTISPNLAGLPAMSIPCGVDNGLPVGLQLIGQYLSEVQLLKVAYHYQHLTDWHTRIPPCHWD